MTAVVLELKQKCVELELELGKHKEALQENRRQLEAANTKVLELKNEVSELNKNVTVLTRDLDSKNEALRDHEQAREQDISPQLLPNRFHSSGVLKAVLADATKYMKDTVSVATHHMWDIHKAAKFKSLIERVKAELYVKHDGVDVFDGPSARALLV